MESVPDSIASDESHANRANQMLRSRDLALAHLPLVRIRSWCRGRPTHSQVYVVGYSVMGLRDRAATTKCLLSWNCAGVGVGPRHHWALVVLLPSPWSPANLDERRWRACRFCKKVFHANKRQAAVWEGSGLSPGWFSGRAVPSHMDRW